MRTLAGALARIGIEVVRFNFSYMQKCIESGKRSLPDKMPSLLQQYSQLIEQVDDSLPLFIGGKSMGGRVASMLSSYTKVSAVFVFGYPFHAPKKQSWRTEHFDDVDCPLFIAQGERDAFGNKDELAEKYWPKVTISWLPDGDHDFKPRVNSGLTQQQLIEDAAIWCSRKIDEVLLATK